MNLVVICLDTLRYDVVHHTHPVAVATPNLAALAAESADFTAAFAESGLKAVAGDIFHYMGSLEGQTQMMILSQGNLRSLMPEANARAEESGALDPVAVGGHRLADELMRVGPMVAIRNPDAAQDKGAQVTRDDWVFSNWDPTKDYTEADYAALSS